MPFVPMQCTSGKKHGPHIWVYVYHVGRLHRRARVQCWGN